MHIFISEYIKILFANIFVLTSQSLLATSQHACAAHVYGHTPFHTTTTSCFKVGFLYLTVLSNKQLVCNT